MKLVQVEANIFLSWCDSAGINNLGDVGTFYQEVVFNNVQAYYISIV